MINSISMGQYLPADSKVHKLDPGVKLIASVFLTASILVASSHLSAIIVSVFIVLAIALARISPALYWNIYKPIWVLLIISFLLQLFLTQGETLLTIGFISLSKTGLIAGGKMLWQFSGLIFVAALLTFSTTPLQLSTALERLLLPLTKLKIPVREFAMAVNLALRFVPTLFDEARSLIAAQRSRGADFTRGGIRDRSKALIPFMVPLLNNIFRRADELAMAMEIRCYSVGAERSSLRVSKLKIDDYFAVLISGIILAISIII